MDNILCIDIGNKNLKAGVFKKGTGIPEFYIVDKEKSIRFLEKIVKKEKINRICGISVVPSVKKEIRKKFNVRFLNHNDFKEIKNPYKEKEKLGIDRIVNVYSALKIYKNNSIVIDFGTAITIDVVRADGKFLGGIIIPSYSIQLDSINKNLSLINVKNLKLSFKLIGKSTEECLRAGIIGITVLGIREALMEIKRKYLSYPLFTIITGGDGKIFKRYIKNSIYNPYLTIYGIYFKAREI